MWRGTSRDKVGVGLANGGPEEFTSLSFLRSLREQVRFEEAALLESFMAAACWDDEMCRQAGFEVARSCSCSAVGTGTLAHLVYDFPEFGATRGRRTTTLDVDFEDEFDETLRKTSRVCERARVGLLVCPALWLRGLLPASTLEAINKPSEKICCKLFGSIPPGGLLTNNLLYLDGSGGRFSKYPSIRRWFWICCCLLRGGGAKVAFRNCC